MSLPHLCPFLATTIRLSKDNSKIINSSFSQRVCAYGPLLEVKISVISCKLKATYVFVFVLSAILNASILEPKISTRYHVYDCDVVCSVLQFSDYETFARSLKLSSASEYTQYKKHFKEFLAVSKVGHARNLN